MIINSDLNTGVSRVKEERKRRKRRKGREKMGVETVKMEKGANKGGKKWLWRSGLDVKETVELR